MGKVWPAAQLLNSFLFKPTLAEGKCSFLSFFHHFCFLTGKKKPSRKIQRHADVTKRGDPGHNQKLVSGGTPPPPPPPYNKSLALKGSPDNGSDAKPREVPRGNSKTPGPPAGGGCQGARCCSFKNIFRCLASAVAGCCLGEGETGRRETGDGEGVGRAGPAGGSSRVCGMKSASKHGAAHLALLNHSQHMVGDICPGFGPHSRAEHKQSGAREAEGSWEGISRAKGLVAQWRQASEKEGTGSRSRGSLLSKPEGSIHLVSLSLCLFICEMG